MNIMILALISLIGLTSFAQNTKTQLSQINLANLSSSEAVILANAQNRVEQLFPPLMKDRLSQWAPQSGFTISVKDLKTNHAGQSNRKGEIILNKSLLLNRELLEKTLIHEWAHQYDFLNVHLDHTKHYISWCQSQESLERSTHLTIPCDLIKRIHSTVSSTPEFLEISGWALLLNQQGNRPSKTSFSLRSPDIYEQSGPGEKFAVNMEYFLTDEQYQCRRPSMYKFFASHFEYHPYAKKNCDVFLKIVDPAYQSIDKALVAIPRNRLYQIHYLLAEGGDQLMSKFGHSMFRLVMCSPTRTQVGPECLQDIQHHIVLSFRASIDTPDISQIAGLNGTYPSRLFFIPLAQVIDEYTKIELRSLRSYPLILTEEEKSDFLLRSIETHWFYEGQYYFLTNNCAVESMNLLRSSLLKENLLTETAQTPYGLLKTLKHLQLLDETPLKNKEAAIKEGYIFQSHENHLVSALNLINSYNTNNQTFTIKTWLGLDPSLRQEYFNATLPADQKEKIRIASAFLLLEKQALRQYRSNLHSEVLKKLESQKSTDSNQDLSEARKMYFFNAAKLRTPALIAKKGYGLPSIEEQTLMSDTLANIKDLKKQANDYFAEIYNQTLLLLDQKNLELKIQANEDHFKSSLRLKN